MSLYLETFINEENKRESFYEWAHRRTSEPMYMPRSKSDEAPQYGIASLFDELSGDEVGELIYTFAPRKDKTDDLSIIDEYLLLSGGEEVYLDLVGEPVPLTQGAQKSKGNRFLADSEYYNRILFETANGFALEQGIGRDCGITAQMCVFPLSVANQAETANPMEEVEFLLFGGGGFTAPVMETGRIFYTVLEGKVGSLRKVSIETGCERLDFYHALIDTGFGLVPLALSEETVRDKSIKENSRLMVDGCIVAKILEVHKGE